MRTPRKIILINRSEHRELDKWSKVEKLSRVLSIVAIPVVLAIGGWIVQNQLQNQTAIVQQQLQNQTVSKDYVQLAVSILREPDQSKIRPELRVWAVDLLNAYSAVKLNESTATQLKNGQIALPPLETFSAVPSSMPEPELDSKLKPALASFQRYLSESGFKIAAGDVKYEIVKGDAIRTESGDFYSLYDPDTRVMRVARDHLGDFDLIRREYMRHVLDPNYPGSRDPAQDHRWFDYYAVGGGIATYFVCSFSESAAFAAGDPKISVNLKNKVRLKRTRDWASAASIGDHSWGGAFWALRDEIGKPSADKLIATTWMLWQPSDPGVDLALNFVEKLIEVDESQDGGKHVTVIRDIFRRRGLKL